MGGMDFSRATDAVVKDIYTDMNDRPVHYVPTPYDMVATDWELIED